MAKDVYKIVETFKKTSPQITIQEIIEKHIPKPFNPVVFQDNLEFQGKWKGEVMPGLISKMKELGWEELQNERPLMNTDNKKYNLLEGTFLCLPIRVNSCVSVAVF